MTGCQPADSRLFRSEVKLLLNIFVTKLHREICVNPWLFIKPIKRVFYDYSESAAAPDCHR